MFIIRGFFSITVVLIFCLSGCDIGNGNLLTLDDLLSETVPPLPMETLGTVNAEASFEQNLLPLLTARCAFAGCHVAGGLKNLDFSTYQTFIEGGDEGPIFIPGDAQGSAIIEEIVSGRMPVGGPQLTNAEIQRFTDWINNQEVTH